MKNYKLYIVGGYVRDKILGIKSKDIDYTFVFDEQTIHDYKDKSVDWFFQEMVTILKEEGFTIFLETPECFTVRAKFPSEHKNCKLIADFVMARKEIGYDHDSRKPRLVMGSLYDDLERRDFTLNAIAEDENGNYIDYFGGIRDLSLKILRTPIEPSLSFSDDPLRVLRMWRFYITKGFGIDRRTQEASLNPLIWEKLKTTVSKERIREELFKMFEKDTLETFKLLKGMPEFVLEIIFGGGHLWLKPTLK